MDELPVAESNGWAADGAGGEVPGAALIEKAFRVLDIVGAAPGAVTTAQLLAQTGWPRATLHRILSAIVARGFLRLDPLARGYMLGFRFMELAQNLWSEHDLVSVASLELRRLRDITGETAYLAVPVDGAMMGLGKFEGAHRVRSAARLGIRKPMHCTSQGKAVLARMGEKPLRDYLKAASLRAFTPKTITDAARLEAQLSIVRQRGYAIEDEEIILGNRCVGAAVLDGSGRPVAAISVAGPVWRLTSERVEQLGPEIAAVAQSIGTQLRAKPQPKAETGGGHPLAHPGGDRTAFYGADPVWDAERGLVLWTDRLGPVAFRTDARNTRAHPLAVDLPIEAACADGDGLRLWQGGASLSFDTRGFGPAREAVPAPLAAARHPDGTIWQALADGEGCGIAPFGAAQAAWTLAGRVTALAWSPQGDFLYAADAARGIVYRLQPGGRAARIFSRVPGVSGEPRGLAVGPGGRLWATLYDGWSAVGFSEEGEIERVVALPVPRPTGIAFGGADGREAFVTTARVGLSRDVLANAPLSGRLLTMRD